MDFPLWLGTTFFFLTFSGILCENSTTLDPEVFTNNSTTFLQHTADDEVLPATSANTTFGKECNTTLDCNGAMSCNNGLCVCPSKSLKVNGTCVGILGLECSSLGQCEQHVANSICEFSTATSGICVCKPGYAAWNLQLTLPTKSNASSRQLHVIANNTCIAVLNAECDGSEGFCSNADNAKCAVFGNSTKKRCVCADGLRPNSESQRRVIAGPSWHTPDFLEEPSTLCEEVIGNWCGDSSLFVDCAQFVENSFCNGVETPRCECSEGFTVNNFTKLCENDTLSGQNNRTAENTSRVAVAPFTDEYQLFVTSRCFMLNYPCAVENSICMHSSFSLYEGICQCEPGYVQTSYTTCESVDGPAEEKPGVDMDDIRTTTDNPETTTKATKPTKTIKATTTTKSPKTIRTTTAATTTTTEGDTTDTTEEPSTEAETTETSTDSGATGEPVTVTSAPVVTNPRNCGVPKSAKSRKSGMSSQFGVRHHSHNLKDMNRIVGGQAAQENEICWQAGVISFMPNLQNYEYCGGSILNENFVLTAMHCVVQNSDVNQPTQLDHIFVSVGASSFPKPSSANTGCGSFRKVSRVTIHPEATFITKGDSTEFLGIANDLALIELEEPLDLDMGCICAICLLDERPAAGEDCIISGYGCQDAECQSPPPHSLSWLKVPIVGKNDDRCQHGTTQLSTDSLVCIESTTDQDACQGDSGGPLSCYDKSTEQFYLAGATSYGFGGNGRSCAAGQLARYTDVIYFLDWIRSVIGNSQN